MRTPRQIPEELSAQVLERLKFEVVRAPSGCLRWLGPHSSKGYGAISVDGKTYPVHRVAYVAANGPIPNGLEVDHVFTNGCRHRDCINPDHLEAVTHQENIRRMKHSRSTCPQGHPYSGDNLFFNMRGHRQCRECTRASKRAWNATRGVKK